MGGRAPTLIVDRTAMAELLTGYGFALKRDDDLLTLAQALPVPIRQRRSLQTGRVTIADR
jgi:hypothetical protein